MEQADSIRNNLIDRLLVISNKDYLESLYKIVERSGYDDEAVRLSAAQKTMLALSENDILQHAIILEDEMNKNDLKWLKEL